MQKLLKPWEFRGIQFHDCEDCLKSKKSGVVTEGGRQTAGWHRAGRTPAEGKIAHLSRADGNMVQKKLYRKNNKKRQSGFCPDFEDHSALRTSSNSFFMVTQQQQETNQRPGS